MDTMIRTILMNLHISECMETSTLQSQRSNRDQHASWSMAAVGDIEPDEMVGVAAGAREPATVASLSADVLTARDGLGGQATGAIDVTASGFGLAVCAITETLGGDKPPGASVEEVLTTLLEFTPSMGDARQLAETLLGHFGSLGAVMAASSASLKRVIGERRGVHLLLRNVHRAMVFALREPVMDRPLLGSPSALKDYLKISMAHEEREVVRLLLLNSRNALILDELHSQGSVSYAPVYPREIVRRLIETSATALIIVHNHPSGDPTPSAADIQMTRQIAAVLAGIGVTLQDSVVVGRHGYSSLRSRGLL